MATKNSILELQKALMDEIIDYQKEHGTDSIVQWNVSVIFKQGD